MLHFKEELVNREQFLENLIHETKKRLETAPKGTLRVSQSEGRIQFFYRKESSDRRGIYMKKREHSLVSELAQKDYDQKICEAAEKELKAIQKCLKSYPDSCPEEIYHTLTDIRQSIVHPIIETEEEFIEKWKSVDYKGKEMMENTTEFLTDHGEQVRSKSELIIANMLAKENIPYRYEYPVQLKGMGVVYPDFTVLNVRLRKELIWEHMGMADDPDYVEKAIRKIAAYNMNGYFEGDQIIFTYETRNTPIHIRQIREIIHHFLL